MKDEGNVCVGVIYIEWAFMWAFLSQTLLLRVFLDFTNSILTELFNVNFIYSFNFNNSGEKCLFYFICSRIETFPLSFCVKG